MGMSYKLFYNLNQSYFITINPDLYSIYLDREPYDELTNILVWIGERLISCNQNLNHHRHYFVEWLCRGSIERFMR